MANNAKTELDGGINDSVTTFNVVDASSFPDEGPFLITVQAGANDPFEIMEVGEIDKGSDEFSDVIRGVEGTSAIAHGSGDGVENRFTAGSYEDLDDEYVNVTGDEMSGTLVFDNDVGVNGRDTDGNSRPVLFINEFNNCQFGNFITPSLITGPQINSLQYMTTDFVTHTVWHSGAVAKVSETDVEVTDSDNGVILKSPDGTRYRITVENNGDLTTTSL